MYSITRERELPRQDVTINILPTSKCYRGNIVEIINYLLVFTIILTNDYFINK